MLNIDVKNNEKALVKNMVKRVSLIVDLKLTLKDQAVFRNKLTEGGGEGGYMDPP